MTQQLRDAFQLIDHDSDGWLTESDLRHIFSSLGIAPSQSMLDDLLAARPGPSTSTPAPGINLTMFLTMMTQRLSEFGPDAELTEAFECFDETDSGTVKADELRKWMRDVGERMDQQEVHSNPCPSPPLTPVQIDKFLKGPFTDRHGNFNYREWIKVLRADESS
ncbi:hypothetical protein HD554DRAFT_2018973 [Boletus coccyginus]|nr:hypothetical protein HD554DRAFT_2018973 [Boletus coccyginus]